MGGSLLDTVNNHTTTPLSGTFGPVLLRAFGRITITALVSRAKQSSTRQAANHLYRVPIAATGVV